MLILCAGPQLQAHGVAVDGAATDWCAPTAAVAADTLAPVTPPGCVLGTELVWNDFDTVADGTADTIGWSVGGVPGPPPGPPFGSLPDPTIDIHYFAATGTFSTLYFLVGLGPFPAFHISPAPHIQIAIDVPGAAGAGTSAWFDPLGVMVPPLMAANLGGSAGIGADYLITTDLGAAPPAATLWEAATTPGTWTVIGPVSVAWSGPGVPGIVEFGVPYASFACPGCPPMGPFIPAPCTVMSAHGAPSVAGPPPFADGPATPPDDLVSEAAASFFTSTPDPCIPGPATAVSPSSTACELIFGPGTGVGSADAFLGAGAGGVPHVVPVERINFTIE